jgi:hypothetical protein
LRRTIAPIAAIAVLALAGCGKEDLGGAPDVRGLQLPEAKQQLKQAGYGTSVKSDATFGVIVEEHFTVCKEHSPKGKLVPLEVSKDC